MLTKILIKPFIFYKVPVIPLTLLFSHIHTLSSRFSFSSGQQLSLIYLNSFGLSSIIKIITNDNCLLLLNDSITFFLMVLPNKLINFSFLSFNTSQQDSLVSFLSLYSLQLIFHSSSLLSFMNSQTKRIHLFTCYSTISLLANTKVPALTFYF